MFTKFQFENEREKESLIDKNKDLFIHRIEYHFDGNYIVFSDEEAEPLFTNKDLANKISILEKDNKALKEELAQIQVSLASLISAISEK